MVKVIDEISDGKFRGVLNVSIHWKNCFVKLKNVALTSLRWGYTI